MIISKFGSTYAGGYAFSQIKAADEIPKARPPVVSQVGGASGAFDFHGDENYPIAPIVARKKFTLTSLTWPGVDTARDALALATIGAGRNKLWVDVRDGTHRWAWAKCISFKEGEANKSYLRQEFELEFELTEGVWYGETMIMDPRYPLYAGSGTIAPAWVSAGKMETPCKITLTQAGGGARSITLLHGGSGLTFTWSGTVSTSVVIDTAAWSIKNGGVDDYANLTIGANQVKWFSLLPGTNTIYYTITGGTMGVTMEWWDAYP